MLIRRGRVASSARRALFILPIWIAMSVWLWTWWFDASRVSNPGLYVALTFALIYEYLVMPCALIYSTLTSKEPKKCQPYNGKKVAIITPCVPSQESIAVIKRQLEAITAVTYPHDSWLLDEGGNKMLKKLAKQHGVKYFTRKNIAKYNRDTYPFKAKTKAGNINAWLDKVRKNDYEFFVQMDIDHLPSPDYLDKTLGHFRDKKIAWVQAPSVYNNLNNWIARASAEQELGFHGTIQMSMYANVQAPVIVGSHTTFRTKAIRGIGGFQPTRAEDHLNTLALMANGWNGVYLPEIIAQGDGPETFSAYLSQQYAWAFSMTQILHRYSSSYLRKLSLKRRLHYLFLETWYPLWSLSYFILFAVPVVGLFFNAYAVHANSTDFIYRFFPAFLSSLLLWWMCMPLAQPGKLNLSWRGLMLHVIRWPIILHAVVCAFMGRLRPYQITPKGKFLSEAPTVHLYRPFLFLSLVEVYALLFSYSKYGTKTTDVLLIFVATSLATMLGVCVVDLIIRLRKIKLRFRVFRDLWLKPIAAVMVVIVLSSTMIGFVAEQNDNLAIALAAPLLVEPRQGDLSKLSPELLSDLELYKELSSTRYAQEETSITPSTGVYSPSDRPMAAQPYIRHMFYDWREDRRLANDLLDTIRDDHTPFITIEPKGENDGAKLLQDIVSGAHDETIKGFLLPISKVKRPVYLRFAHEMDLKNLYPWGDQESELYINAYRHVHDMADAKGIKNIRWIWGPAGVAGADAYYPGDSYVDVIGTTILTDRYWTGDAQFTFFDLSSSRLWLAQYGKPIWVTEFGVGNHDRAYQAALTKEAATNFIKYGFSALVYINIPDSNVAGPDYSFDSSATLMDVLGLNDLPLIP